MPPQRTHDRTGTDLRCCEYRSPNNRTDRAAGRNEVDFRLDVERAPDRNAEDQGEINDEDDAQRDAHVLVPFQLFKH